MKKNLAKKALVPALAMAIASIIALSGVTYAWFTTGTTANVQNLDVNVQTANGIQVSLDAQNWKSVITAADIITAITGASDYTNRVIQFPEGEIAPVSTAGKVVDGKMEMFLGAYNSAGTMDSTVASEINGRGGNYISFDLFFKTNTEGQELTLNVGASMSEVKCIDLAKKVGDAAAPASDAGTEKAVRVAFIPMETAPNADAARASTANGTALIWEPNADDRVSGVDAATGRLDYSGFKTTFSGIAESALGAEQVEAVKPFYENQIITTLQPGITKVRVYIWLEGQDVDCINNISNGDFTVSLAFSVPKAATDESN